MPEVTFAEYQPVTWTLSWNDLPAELQAYRSMLI